MPAGDAGTSASIPLRDPDFPTRCAIAEVAALRTRARSRGHRMKTPVPEDLALDGAGVRKLLADPLAAWSGVRVQSCSARLLKRTSKRLLVRYELEGGGRKLRVVGKWYSTDRGALVSRSLSLLRAEGFA